MAPLRYHRFRPDEHCDSCMARAWYAEEGLRYCRNGHRLAGFAPAAGAADGDGDEDAYGTAGRVSRQRQEKRRKPAVKLTGAAGRELYLEGLQLVLRRQVRWLVEERGLPEDVEGLVKGLWMLWVGAGEQDEEEAQSAATAGRKQDNEIGKGSAGKRMSSSSLSETDSDSAAESGRPARMPRLIDTLALCYLGCLAARLPVTTAGFHRWAQRGDVVFLSAVG